MRRRVARASIEMIEIGEDQLGANGRPQAHEQRKDGKIAIVRLRVARPEIAVEQQIRLRDKAARHKVHQREGEIVQQVASGDALVEFDGVEQDRRVVDQRDIAEMQIAMTTAYASPSRATAQDIARSRQRATRGGDQGFGAGGIEEGGRGGEGRLVLRDIIAERAREIEVGADRRTRVGGDDDARKTRDTFAREFSARGEAVEGHRFVKAPHAHGPFDDLARAADFQATGINDDGNDAQIDGGRVAAVDGKLGLAGEATLFQRGKIHEGKAHRALDLVNIVAREKDDGAMGVDALNRAAMGRRVAEKGQNSVLRGEIAGHAPVSGPLRDCQPRGA